MQLEPAGGASCHSPTAQSGHQSASQHLLTPVYCTTYSFSSINIQLATKLQNFSAAQMVLVSYQFCSSVSKHTPITISSPFLTNWFAQFWDCVPSNISNILQHSQLQLFFGTFCCIGIAHRIDGIEQQAVVGRHETCSFEQKKSHFLLLKIPEG